ncbi:MAG: response regulator transcription factor [Elusimicrobia bacterium]|nr:response regulator transcription factor [Elusimicrobiota bacterium]
MARILSIEDDPDLQHLIGLSLHSNGYEIQYAFNGKEGYEKILSMHPDLVLLDLMLPGMNGVEILKAVKSNKDVRDLPIIVLTAYGDDASMLEHSVKALGAVEYLRKPVEIAVLLSHIKRALAANPRQTPPPDEIRRGSIRADPSFRTIFINDRLVATLPSRRFDLFRLLLEADGELTKEALCEKLGGTGTVYALEKAIQRLREDLGPLEAKRIQTTPAGYRLIP